MNAMNMNINIGKLETMEIPVVMTREDWEKEYEAEYRKKCMEKVRKYFVRKIKKVIRKVKNVMETMMKIVIAAAIFYGVMCVITIFVEWICTSVWI